MVSPCPKQCGQCGWESLRATDSIAGRVRGCECRGGGGGKLAFHVFDQPWHRVESVRLGAGGGGAIGERHGRHTCGERIETKGVQCLECQRRAVVVRPSHTQVSTLFSVVFDSVCVNFIFERDFYLLVFILLTNYCFIC